jgi:hypothetical protein
MQPESKIVLYVLTNVEAGNVELEGDVDGCTVAEVVE